MKLVVLVLAAIVVAMWYVGRVPLPEVEEQPGPLSCEEWFDAAVDNGVALVRSEQALGEVVGELSGVEVADVGALAHALQFCEEPWRAERAERGLIRRHRLDTSDCAAVGDHARAVNEGRERALELEARFIDLECDRREWSHGH